MAYLGWVAFIILLDQVSKLLVVARLQPYQSIPVIDGLLSFTLAKNPGGAFGLFRGQAFLVMVITAAISLGLLGALLFGRFHDGPFKLGLALIAGGALGNLIDRVRLGYVIDFISLRFWQPVFNLADVAIVVGTAIIALALLRRAA